MNGNPLYATGVTPLQDSQYNPPSGNPFYVDPGGRYTAGLNALQQSLETVRRQKIKQEALKVFEGGDPQAMARFSIENPEWTEQLRGMSKFKNARTEKNQIDTMYAIDRDPSPENVAKVIAQRNAFLDKEGVPQEQRQDTQKFMEAYSEDQEKGLQEMRMSMASKDPRKYLLYTQAKEGHRKKSTLTANMRDYLRAKKEDGFVGTYIEYRQAISRDPTTDLRILSLRLDMDEILHRRAARKEKLAGEKQKKANKKKYTVERIARIMAKADEITGMSKESVTGTGILGALTGKIPETPAYNIRAAVKMLAANLSFHELQKMRESSPTGGALGQVSNIEIDLLQSTIATLDPNMGSKKFEAALKEIKEHYARWKLALEGQIPEGYDETGTWIGIDVGGSKEEGGLSGQSPGTPEEVGGRGQSQEIPTIDTQEEYDKLPPGTPFYDVGGQSFTK